MAYGYVDALIETADEGISFDGLVVEYDGTYSYRTPETELTDLSESQLREVATGSPHVTNWYFWHAVAPQKEDRWAFLRWLEESDDQGVSDRYEALETSIVTQWGQLEITVRLGEDGTRTYRLAHVDDPADSDRDSYADPRRARELATYTDEGQYRPLKTAPTLRTGWEFSDLGPAALVETVDFFYPATITNWHRERTGTLDVTHWTETMARQTGMYGVIQTWDRGEGHEHAEWVAESCCRDSQCLKRRVWQYDEETDLDTPGGDGHFPCREPCSLVITAARKFTKLDAEEPRTYEFELTPSEKEQLEALVDAVADGTVAGIRDADISEGANQFRTRFLRARRFDEEGRLSGTQTEE